MNDTVAVESLRQSVSDYYGKQLQSTEDLQTSACCDAENVPEWLKPVLSAIHPEVLARYYGCGLVAPAMLDGRRVLDLGCGTGRDVYALAQLAGSGGHVTGVDMTDEQLDVARAHQDWHSERFGFANTTFLKGYIEELEALPLEPGSFDVIVSNCVVNLAADKEAVLRGVFRLLEPGGEFYFSDVYADRRIPEELRKDEVLYGECLSGALYWNDFLTLAKRAGFADPRLVTDRPLDITNAEVASKTGNIRFHSATYRLFKLENLESACEDYGQAVVYRGGIEGQSDSFLLDKHHEIETGKVFPVCGNTWRMLSDTRFSPHFEFLGDFSRHYGIFAGCGTDVPFTQAGSEGSQDSSCC
ncbi:methyltransferase type 11 [Rhodococcus sp. WMMA185]|uniref:methyltransferase domain-containing protein n=1 Tax=Rhodococcus sp. WMMA185 TaxID=679318 RepID=UPI000878A65F|nr:methyltransferase domain-containing protein [Rhodococcus sp. WMMA185]AOW93445.1 methyltransferase type 11 [Rhodococcus sp. WMMA185]